MIKNRSIVALMAVVLISGFVMALAGAEKSSTTFARMQDPVTLVRDVDNPTKQPFQEEVKVTVAAGAGGQNGSVQIVRPAEFLRRRILRQKFSHPYTPSEKIFPRSNILTDSPSSSGETDEQSR